MKSFIYKTILITLVTILIGHTERFKNIINLYSFNECEVFNSFPRSDLPLAIRSESSIFNNCYKSLKGSNIKLVDRENEAKILNELARQSMIPAREIIEIGELITPHFIITETPFADYTKIKMTSVKTGEISWEKKSKSILFSKHLNLIFLVALFFIIWILIKIISTPYQRRAKAIQEKSNQLKLYNKSLNLIKTGNIRTGMDLLIECSTIKNCVDTKKKALDKLRAIKSNIGANI